MNKHHLVRQRVIAAMLAIAAVAPLSHPALAHDGPPYQVIADATAGPYITSVWADPDLGGGVIYLMVQPPATEASTDSTDPAGSRSAATSPADIAGSPLAATVAARPADGHLPEIVYPARFDPVAGADDQRYIADLPFDAEGPWDLRIMLQGAAGAGELAVAVDVRPSDGPQLWEVAIYVLPFALLALVFVWARWKGRGEREGHAPKGHAPVAVRTAVRSWAPAGGTAFRAGDRVKHPRFGEGVVVSSAVRDGDEEGTVAFAGLGVKRFMQPVARLVKV